MIVETENSVYEITQDRKKVRRLTGQTNPTPRQGIDGEWKPVNEVVISNIGEPMLIVWEVQAENELVLRTTLTSPIVRIMDSLN